MCCFFLRHFSRHRTSSLAPLVPFHQQLICRATFRPGELRPPRGERKQRKKQRKSAIIIRGRRQQQLKQEEPRRGLAEGCWWGKRTTQTLQQPPITITQDKQARDRAIRLQGLRPGRAGRNTTSGWGKSHCAPCTSGGKCDKAAQEESPICGCLVGFGTEQTAREF